MIWLIVGWVVCGVLAWMLTFGYFQWHYKDLGRRTGTALLATFNALMGPLGLIPPIVAGDVRDAWSYWKNGCKSEREMRPTVDITPWLTSFSITAGQTAASLAAVSRAIAEASALPPPVEETWTPEPVLAWRWWSLNLYDLTLSGAVARWESGTMTARHRSDRATYAYTPHHRDAPYPGCLCGVNALKATAVHEYLDGPPQGIDVVGRVALTGTVDEYEKGYRAEKAEIVELVILADLPLLRVAEEPILDALERRYGVRPTIQLRESWLAEMEVIHGLGKEDSSDRVGTGGSTAGGTIRAGQGASQAGLTAFQQALMNYQVVGRPCTCAMCTPPGVGSNA